MGTEVIKSFLVGLGFGVDDKTLAQFNKAIASAAIKVTALYGSIKLAAAGIFYGISKISQSFENMGYELRLIQPAMNKWLVLRQAMLTAYAKAGVNLSQVVRQSILFNYSLAKTKFALEAVYKSVAARFFPMLTKQMDIFRAKIFANMPKIQNALEKFVIFIFKAFEATVHLGNRLWSILTRVWDFFVRLDKATGGWSTTIAGVLAAWKLLNLEFLATPLGMLIASFAALLVLWDDFMTFREGGQSFINWGSDFTKTIVGLGVAVAGMAAVWGTAKTAMMLYAGAAKIATAVQWALDAAMDANPVGLVVIAITALIGLITALDAKWQLFGGHVTGFFGGLGGKIMDFFAGSANPGNPQAGAGPLLPAGAAGTQNVHQQTQITVNGAADAHSVGKAVAGQQDRVNFDMTRNLKGSIQ